MRVTTSSKARFSVTMASTRPVSVGLVWTGSEVAREQQDAADDAGNHVQRNEVGTTR